MAFKYLIGGLLVVKATVLWSLGDTIFSSSEAIVPMTYSAPDSKVEVPEAPKVQEPTKDSNSTLDISKEEISITTEEQVQEDDISTQLLENQEIKDTNSDIRVEVIEGIEDSNLEATIANLLGGSEGVVVYDETAGTLDPEMQKLLDMVDFEE